MADEYTPTTEDVRDLVGRGYEALYYDDRGIGEDRFDRWLAAHDAEVARAAAEKALRPIRDALAGHPRCDVHPDGDPIACGWKRAVSGVQAVLDEADRPAGGEPRG